MMEVDTAITSDLGREKMGESCIGVMDVGLRRMEEAALVEAEAVSSCSGSSSPPVLTLSSSDLFTYFLPLKKKNANIPFRAHQNKLSSS